MCGDSHTSTHGALGAYAFGIGASEVAHVLMMHALWQRKPKRMRITVNGRLAPGITAKDIVLAIIASIGADGATGHAIEFAGSAIRALSIEGRLTLCNMSIEAGARSGMIAPDETTFEYVKGRPYSPKGKAFEQAVEAWSALTTDDGTEFDREVELNATDIAPIVTGHEPAGCPPDRRQRAGSCTRAGRGAREISARGTRLYGAHARREAHQHCDRPHLHRLLHECTYRGPARSSRGRGGSGQQGSRTGVAWLFHRQAPSRGGSSTASSVRPGSSGANPAAPCASGSTAMWCRRGSAARRPPIAISVVDKDRGAHAFDVSGHGRGSSSERKT